MTKEIDYNSQLDEAQQRAMARLSDESCPNVFVFWWKMGTGKTRLALHTFLRSDFLDMIVVCRRISFGDWVDEMELCQMDFLVYQNDYTPKNILKLAPYKKDSMKQKRVLLLSAGDLKSIPSNFPKGQLLVVDELYLFSNPKSKRSKLLKQMSLFCSARIGLSGTIKPARDSMSVFGQLSALNAHHPLASGTTEFRSKFQVKSNGRFGTLFVDKPSTDKVITELIKDRVDINFPKGRPTRHQIISVDKTPAQRKAIEQLKETYAFRHREYKYAVQLVHVINGLSNGWFVDDDDNGKLLCYKSQKIERMLTLVDDILAGGDRVVVWCAYHADIARISKDLKHPWLEFTARIPFDQEKWKSKNSPSVVLATEANGSSVNHFKDVKYGIYFSIDFKMLHLDQSEGRHERKGSAHDGAHYYFLQTKGTLDARAYQLVTKSKESEENLIQTLIKEIFP